MTKLRIVLTFLVLAALPLVLSVAIVYFGSTASDGSKYWAVAPWLTIVALLWTPGWMLIVAIALAVYVSKRGLRKSSLRHENLVVSAVIAAVIACTFGPYAIWKARQNSRMELVRADEHAGRDVVRSSDVVSERMNAPFQVYTQYYGRELNGTRRLVYAASRNGSQVPHWVYVVVDIEPTAEGRSANIVCILSREDYGDRPDYENLCKPAVRSNMASDPKSGS